MKDCTTTDWTIYSYKLTFYILSVVTIIKLNENCRKIITEFAFSKAFQFKIHYRSCIVNWIKKSRACTEKKTQRKCFSCSNKRKNVSTPTTVPGIIGIAIFLHAEIGACKLILHRSGREKKVYLSSGAVEISPRRRPLNRALLNHRVSF